MSSWAVYGAVFRMRLLQGLQYRVAALAGVATQFCFGIMLTMIYAAFYASGEGTPPMALPALISYIWLQQAFLAFVELWFRDRELFRLITSGNIAYELCRPCTLYGFWYAKLIAQRWSAALLRCLPILLAAFLLPEPYRLHGPAGGMSLVLFMAALLLGLHVLVAISMFIYISVFYTLSPLGSTLMIGLTGNFFAGFVIPIPLMPPWQQTLAYLLPFRLACDLPFRIYSGDISPHDALSGLALQIVWLAVLVTAGRLALARTLRRIVVQGG